jgi:dTMP kinase
MSRGKFITIEGGEGVGKSTQIAALRAMIASHSAGGKQVEVVLTREPGGTARADRIRELLLTRGDEPMPVMCELLLMFAARSTHIENVIRPALERGQWVVCDRFTDSTYAYQGGGRGVAQEHIETLERLVQGSLRPDLTVLLDAPVEVGAARVDARAVAGDARDRFESEQHAFFERVRAAYLERARREPQRFVVVDGTAARDVVSAAILAAVRSRLFS